MRLDHFWLILGVLFVAIGLSDFMASGSWRPLLTIAIGALVAWSSVINLGGTKEIKRDIKRLFK